MIIRAGTSGPYHDAYANLAAAILASGVKCHDTAFLKSNWCDILKEICRLDDQMYGGRGINKHGSVILSKGMRAKHEFD